MSVSVSYPREGDEPRASILRKQFQFRRTLCKIAHVVHGLISGFLAVDNLALSVFLWIQFLTYEAVEWKVKKDKMYPELREWSIGFVLGILSHSFLLEIA